MLKNHENTREKYLKYKKYLFVDEFQDMNQTHFDLISELLTKFQNLTFLIDSGFDYPFSVEVFSKKLKKREIQNFLPVIGTEKLKNYNFQSFKFFSLFFTK